MKRGTLIRSKREYLERLANWLKLDWCPEWSSRHLANLIYWRITRNNLNRH